MTEQRIMYVCSKCADDNPEGCGRYDLADLVVMPGGEWLCDGCYDDLPGEHPPFHSLPNPPEYGPITRPQRDTPESKS